MNSKYVAISLQDLYNSSGDTCPYTGQSEAEMGLRKYLEARNIPTTDELEAHAYALEDQVKGLQELMAEQHQGEPVAWQVNWPDGSRELYTHEVGAKASMAPYQALYTHADPGEVSLQQIMHAYEYAESHPHKYLRGTTNWCAAVAWHLNKNRGAQSGE